MTPRKRTSAREVTKDVGNRAVDALEAEIDAGDEPVAVLLDGVTIHVKPVRDWRSSGLRALREGDFTTWAERCLVADSIPAWEDVDPTIGDIETFFTEWTEVTGQSVGKSPASPRYSTSTRMK